MTSTLARTPIRRRYIDGPFGQVHIAEAGQGQPILLIHQTPRSWDEFREVMELLDGQMRLIAMDLPGMGSSDPIPSGASIEGYAQAAAAVISSIVEKDMMVCGHHTGGVVAIELAANYSSLVSSIVLSSTPWIDSAVRKLRSKKRPMDSVERANDGSHLTAMWQQRSAFYPKSHTYLDRFIRDALCSNDPVEGHVAVGDYKMELSAPKVNCPTLLITHMNDPFTRNAQHLMSAFPSAELVQIDGGEVALEVTAEDFSEALGMWATKY